MKFKQGFKKPKPLSVKVHECKPTILGNERPHYLKDSEMMRMHKGKSEKRED